MCPANQSTSAKYSNITAHDKLEEWQTAIILKCRLSQDMICTHRKGGTIDASLLGKRLVAQQYCKASCPDMIRGFCFKASGR